MPQQEAAAAESVTMLLAEAVSQRPRTTGSSRYIPGQRAGASVVKRSQASARPSVERPMPSETMKMTFLA